MTKDIAVDKDTDNVGNKRISNILPNWLNTAIPSNFTPLATIDVVDAEIVFTLSDGVKEVFDLNDLSGLEKASRGVQFEFTENAKAALSAEFGSVSFPVREGFYGMIFSHTDKDKLELLECEYEEFLKVAKEYESNPNDFYLSYYFVNAHPAFWLKEAARGNTEPSWNWNTSFHCEKLSHFVNKTEDGEIQVILETGGHVEPNYTEHYLDFRLTAKTPTFEQSFIQLAANVDKFFNLDGSEREDSELSDVLDRIDVALSKKDKNAKE